MTVRNCSSWQVVSGVDTKNSLEGIVQPNMKFTHPHAMPDAYQTFVLQSNTGE